MLIVGELINSSRKKIGTVIEQKDAAEVQRVALEQSKAGADYIDVNAGTFVGEEAKYLVWLVETVQMAVQAPCCIDSPDPEVIEAALKVHKGDEVPMINSISLEKDRLNALLPVVSGTNLKVVALCMSDEGMPETAEQRLEIADRLINKLVQNNVFIENIYVDPLVQPLSTRDDFGKEFLEAIDGIKRRFPGVHTMCGLSNISFGLPARKFLNQIFIVMAILKGLDGAIINPLDRGMMASIIAAQALVGLDPYCTNYLKAYRNGMFDN